MESWWRLGEGSGFRGLEIETSRIECAFCEESGNWKRTHRSEKKHAQHKKTLYFDTYQCGNCAAYTQVFWSHGDGLHDYRVQPWPLRPSKAPEYLSEAVGRFYLQSQKALASNSYDAAAVMIRSTMQCALRENGATGKTLRDEIESLGTQGVLPKLMIEWSHGIRLVGNDSAHPTPEQEASPQDVSVGFEYLKFLLEYLYKLPREIGKVRKPTK